jgi:membrane-bound lytic murein transglycosylase A
VVAALGTLLACAPEPPAPPPEPELRLSPIAFTGIDGWERHDPRPALEAFLASCEAIRRRPADDAFGSDPAYGRVADWLAVCAAGEAIGAADAGAARRFLETWLQPYAVSDDGDEIGLFTGYYEPLLHGALEKGPPYEVPLYAAPDDLLLIDLAAFDPDLVGRRVIGRVEGDRVVPYYSRGEIEAGALDGRALELLWVDDPIDKFFLQIQGSGQVRLDDGSLLRVGYAGKNGHAYRAIGRDLIEAGELTREEVSVQSIRAWMEANPDRAPALMRRNGSYVFFRELEGLAPDAGPPGAQGVPLTPTRSLAVDPRFVALGTPVWLETRVPWRSGEAPFERLMVAQDVGGAIKGVVRGDVFFGAGPEAEAAAGRMKHPGRMIILLPAALTPTG